MVRAPAPDDHARHRGKVHPGQSRTARCRPRPADCSGPDEAHGPSPREGWCSDDHEQRGSDSAAGVGYRVETNATGRPAAPAAPSGAGVVGRDHPLKPGPRVRLTRMGPEVHGRARAGDQDRLAVPRQRRTGGGRGVRTLADRASSCSSSAASKSRGVRVTGQQVGGRVRLGDEATSRLLRLRPVRTRREVEVLVQQRQLTAQPHR